LDFNGKPQERYYNFIGEKNMQTYFSLTQYDEIAGVIRGKTKEHPKIAIILGSGLGSLADSLENQSIIPFNDLPHWPVSTVQGHVGRLVIGTLEGQCVLVMQGRIHFYEGYTMQQVTLPNSCHATSWY
jgi:purine-nucleoside phosphorylase